MWRLAFSLSVLCTVRALSVENNGVIDEKNDAVVLEGQNVSLFISIFINHLLTLSIILVLRISLVVVRSQSKIRLISIFYDIIHLSLHEVLLWKNSFLSG